MYNFKCYILFICFYLMAFSSFGQERYFPVESDTPEEIELREISTESLETYKNNEVFNYSEKTKGKSHLEEIWRNFWRNVSKKINQGLDSRVVWYCIIIAAIIFVGWFLLNSQSSSFISQKNTDNRAYIEELDIRIKEELINR